MKGFKALLNPAWGAEKWIAQGWQALTTEEQQVVTQRMDALFSDGLPFVLVHDKILYIYAFSLLAQLEVLAIQVPLKFEKAMPSEQLKARMREQLMDEVFHGMVFTRILYELMTPYAMPPAYNPEIEALCNFIREESCEKTAVVLLNLVAESLIEELFRAFYQADVAPAVFSVILEDEHRHVCEAELYRALGLPELDALKEKLFVLEEKLISSVFLNYPYVNALTVLLGVEGLQQCFLRQDKKHRAHLKTFQLAPGQAWEFYAQSMAVLSAQVRDYAAEIDALQLPAGTQVLMTQWKAPSDPTMTGEFDLDIDKLCFFEKKYPPETITVLTLQAVSQGVLAHDVYRRYLSYHQLYQIKQAYVALVVKLPGCDAHLGMMVFKNCHEHSVSTLVQAIQQNLQLMVWCYKKRLELEQKHPHFAPLTAAVAHQIATGVYPYPMPGNPVVSVSNAGMAGYQRGKSPLRVNEALKLTLFSVQRKPVWDDATQTFKPKDCLPVSVSSDHRIFNGDIPVPKHLTAAFNQMLDQMLRGEKPHEKPARMPVSELLQLFDFMAEKQPRVAYKLLLSLQTVWPDFIDISAWVKAPQKVVA